MHVFCKCLKYIGNMCSHVPHAQQMLAGGEKNKTMQHVHFSWKKNRYGVYDRLITYRKGDFLFWGHGNKDYKWQPLDLDSHGFSLRSNCFSKTHTHKPFSLCLNICHLQTEKKLNFSDQATGPLVQSWLNNDNNMLLICLFELFTVFLVCFGFFLMRHAAQWELG